jgi:hypothetical protein
VTPMSEPSAKAPPYVRAALVSVPVHLFVAAPLTCEDLTSQPQCQVATADCWTGFRYIKKLFDHRRARAR